jgi:hypothetical protein
MEKSWVRLFNDLSRLPRIGRRLLSNEEKDFIKSIDIGRAKGDVRLSYWFPQAQTIVLEQILELILMMRGTSIRTFFLCAFSNILRGCSIWLSGSTKPQKDLTKRLSDPVAAFCRQTRDMMRRNKSYWEDLSKNYQDPCEVIDHCTIRVKDARYLPINMRQLDLLVTSPPYATCYQYLEIHQLTQLWFEKFGVLRPVRLQASCIGGHRSSKKSQQKSVISTGSKSADQALLRLANRGDKAKGVQIKQEVRALRSYFLDMKNVIEEGARVVAPNKYFVLVVGDSWKRNINIPTSTALSEMAEKAGFNLEARHIRKVPARVLVSTRNRSTGRFSSTEESDTHAYPEEDVLIFKRRAKSLRKRV